MTRVRRAAAALARVEAQASTARQDLYDAIREAHAAGESTNLIAELAGITRQAVWQIVKKED